MYLLKQHLILCLPALAAAQYAATTTWTFTGNTLPTGLRVSTDYIGTSDPDLLSHQFDASNVVVEDGFLQLVVPGGQEGESVISTAEITTDFEVLYASVSTYAILTEEPGVCNGNFFYHSDSQEIDIEWISDPESLSNTDSSYGSRSMQYTNQATNGGESTFSYGPAPSDATSAVHEYRIDWSAESTKFYLDGGLQQTFDTNVPSTPGPWVWNNWVNGDPGWTVGPPENDAVFKIQKIVMSYNEA